MASNVWRHVLKVYNLHRGLPIVAMTAGMANFGSMSITSLAKDLRIRIEESLCRDSHTLDEVSIFAAQYFHDEHGRSH